MHSIKYLTIAYNEIEQLQNSVKNAKKLSELEKIRIAMKFLEMNSSPERYGHLERFKEENIKKVKLNLDMD